MLRRIIPLIIILTTFALGLFTAQNVPQALAILEQPYQGPINRASPSDTITKDMIRVYKDGVIVTIDEEDHKWMVKMDLSDPTWSTFTDTKSMDPVFDKGSYTIRIKVPCEELYVGDIATYEHATQGKIIHRIVHKDQDEQGTYFVFKGDNNPTSDPGKVRCEQVLGKVVAIFY